VRRSVAATAAAGADTSMAAPQDGQNRAPAGAGCPHSGQILASGAPQEMQNRLSAPFSTPHAEQTCLTAPSLGCAVAEKNPRVHGLTDAA
jgi:hypothetical protein